MLYLNKKLLFKSKFVATCSSLSEPLMEWELTDELVYNEERDKGTSVSVVSCIDDCKLLYYALRIRWIVHVLVWLFVVVVSLTIWLKTGGWWSIFVLGLLSFIFGDRILQWPNGNIQDDSGNILHVDVGWLHVPGKCVVKLNG